MAQKNLIGLMVREGLITFVRIDRSVFEKTSKEKANLKKIRNDHNKQVRNLGYNPKKTFNPKEMTL